MSKQETEKAYIEKFGERHGKIALGVYSRWVYACAWFYDLRKLCTHDDIKGLPEFMGGAYYQRLRNLLWQDTMLTISRLTDPPTQGKQGEYENLTVCWLPTICEGKPIEAEIKQLIKDVRKHAKPIRKWRNRVYAHSELTQALNPGAKQLAYVDLGACAAEAQWTGRDGERADGGLTDSGAERFGVRVADGPRGPCGRVGRSRRPGPAAAGQ